MKCQTLRSAIVSLALALMIVCLFSQSVGATDTWTRVNSKHFTLIGNASEKEIRQVATRLRAISRRVHPVVVIGQIRFAGAHYGHCF